jgi:hypothetical protein
MSKIVVALACTLPFILVGCGGESASAPLLTAPTNPATAPTGSTSSGPTTPTTQTINFNSAPLALGSTVILQGTASSGLPVIYASQTPNVCSVSGSTVTALALGSCTLTVNQAGNTSFSAAPQIQRIIAVLNVQSITGVSALTLSMGQLLVLNPISTSGLPVQIATLTPATCLVGQNIAIYAVTTGTCTLLASQTGNGQFAAAPSLTLTTTVTPSNTSLAHNAVFAPWITTAQAGSTEADSTTSLEGIYQNTSGAFALIDGANHFDYFDFNSLLFGSLTQSAMTWTLNSSASLFPTSTTAVTANGSFNPKQNFKGIAQSFTTITPLIDLTYSKDNRFAASPSSVAGNWLYNDGAFLFNLTMSNTGTITGTEVDSVGGACQLTGSIVQTEPASQHNMYSITLHAANASGAFCNLSTSADYTGLAALSFVPAGVGDSNGYLPSLTLFAQTASAVGPLMLTFFQP